jgi:hypothetical protein
MLNTYLPQIILLEKEREREREREIDIQAERGNWSQCDRC